jgi:hypothetical protein
MLGGRRGGSALAKKAIVKSCQCLTEVLSKAVRQRYDRCLLPR